MPNRRRNRPAPSFVRPRPDGSSAYRPVTRYPFGTVIWEGPTNRKATKVVIGVIRDRFGKVDPMEFWLAENDLDMRDDPAVQERIDAFFAPHNVTTVANNRQITGCPHIEGEGYPEGQDCPWCSYWQNRDPWTGERRFRSLVAGGNLPIFRDSDEDFGDEYENDADDPWGSEFYPAYDPDDDLDVDQWLELDEDDRLGIVRTFHRRAAIVMPNRLLHGNTHVIIENQVAAGDEVPTKGVIERLRDEGLSRHNAVHAVGDVLMRHVFRLMNDKDATAESSSDPNAVYFAALDAQTAAKWLASALEDDEEE